jgi:hypothetical protein
MRGDLVLPISPAHRHIVMYLAFDASSLKTVCVARG